MSAFLIFAGRLFLKNSVRFDVYFNVHFGFNLLVRLKERLLISWRAYLCSGLLFLRWPSKQPKAG